MHRWMKLVAIGLLMMSSAACATVPATGEKKLILIDPQQEIAMGEEAAPEFTKEYGGDIPDPVIVAYVNNVGMQLANVSELKGQVPWEFHVVDSGVLNAFAIPGGKVFISRELLFQLSSEAELAGVLGHEIGHVTCRHTAQQMSTAMLIQGLALGVGVAGAASGNDYVAAGGAALTVGGQLFMLKFSRDDESQADAMGVRYMTRCGYNPVAQIRVMEVLKRASGGSSQTPVILQTHPLPQQRIDDLEKLIQKDFPNYNDPAAWKLNQAQFQAAVLDRAGGLPPPRHDPEYKYHKKPPK